MGASALSKAFKDPLKVEQKKKKNKNRKKNREEKKNKKL